MKAATDLRLRQGYIYLCLVLVAIFTSLWGYAYGVGDQLTFIPLIEKLNNPNYLATDAIYNMRLEGYDTRMYYAYLCLFFMKLLGLPLSFLLATILTNIAIGIATYKVTIHLSKEPIAAWLAGIIALTVSTVTAGTDSTIHCDLFSPGDLAFAIGLFMFLAMLKRQLLLLGILSAIATLMHILIGAVLGILFWGYILWAKSLDKELQQLLKQKGFWLGAFVFLVGLAGHLYLYSSQLPTIRMTDEVFIETYAYYRIPHHIIPSFFLYKAELRSLILLILMFLTELFLWRKFKQELEGFRVLSYCFVVLSLLLLGGYLFVEIFPSRLWVTLQVFRYYFIIKWLNLILCSILIISLWKQPKYRFWGIALAIAIPLHTWAAFLVLALGLALLLEALLLSKFAIKKELEQLLKLGGFVLFMLSVSVYFLGFGIAVIYVVSLVFLGLFCLAQYTLKWAITLHLLLVVALGISWTTLARYELEHPEKMGFSYFISRQYNEEELSKENPKRHELIQYIQKNTAIDAVLLTPPDEDRFRLLAQRAVVVDPRGFPFGEQAVLVWRERLETCYGPTTHRHINTAIPQNYIPNYQKMKDAKRQAIAKKYNAQYIVLNANCSTTLPTVFDNGVYKLIELKKVM